MQRGVYIWKSEKQQLQRIVQRHIFAITPASSLSSDSTFLEHSQKMNFEEKLDTLQLLFDIMKNDHETEERMVEQLAGEAKTVIRDLHHYFFVLHFYHDTHWTPVTVHKDPSVKYFGMDWNALSDKIVQLRSLIKQYHHDQQDSVVKEVLETLQDISGDLTHHLVAVRYLHILKYFNKILTMHRSGRLKSKTLKDQEALQRRVAIAARTGHDDRNSGFERIIRVWKKLFN